jgi:hypothetical protein
MSVPLMGRIQHSLPLVPSSTAILKDILTSQRTCEELTGVINNLMSLIPLLKFNLYETPDIICAICF